jgi:uncharacterized protein (DUF1499 family)
LSFEGSAEDALEALKRALRGEPRLDVVDEKPADHYLRAEATSAVLRFVDDVELQVMAKEKVIEVRSASRLGYWDLGVNRRRVERLRERFRDTLGNS